jgi:hypothetical protein
LHIAGGDEVTAMSSSDDVPIFVQRTAAVLRAKVITNTFLQEAHLEAIVRSTGTGTTNDPGGHGCLKLSPSQLG